MDIREELDQEKMDGLKDDMSKKGVNTYWNDSWSRMEDDNVLRRPHVEW